MIMQYRIPETKTTIYYLINLLFNKVSAFELIHYTTNIRIAYNKIKFNYNTITTGAINYRGTISFLRSDRFKFPID